MTKKDPFDLSEKPLDSMLTIPAELHEGMMALSPEERRDREKVNETHRAEQKREPRR
jgi:hypothetical protein